MTSAMTEPKITLTVAQIQHLARLAEAARFSGSLTVGAPELLALCTLALQALDMEPRKEQWTYGHCPEKQKPGGCQLHNLHCTYPDCDRRPAT